MASAPQPTLPLFYQDLMPLNSRDHAKWRNKPVETISWLAGQHAIPLTAEEFVQAQRDYPIVFSAGDSPVPLALMGLNEGVNTFIDDEGRPIGDFYLPAYARRYPYMLARLTPEAEELSLCFDPTADIIGAFDEGELLFAEDGQPAAPIQAALQFCEQFEQAGARTQAFMDELKKHDILMDGEVAITQSATPDKPYIYRGFRMVDEAKLRSLDAAVLKQWTESGLLALVFAQMFSLDRMRVIFDRQMSQGKVPEQAAETIN
jgi:hypothetical protein